jgi:hypothetical protein
MPVRIVIFLFLFISLVAFFYSCSKEKYVQPQADLSGCIDTATLFTFQKDILPILNLNCNFDECHGQGGKGSYDFTQYGVVANRVKYGTFEYRIDLPADDPQHMPEKMLLNNCDYNTLKAWIRQGYPEK